jgi:RNAse (barnase) inhibitor barstar
VNNAIASILESHKAGVWFLPGNGDARAVQSAAKKARYTYVHIDGSKIERKEQLLNALATALRLPKSFGHNWDALEECLNDLEGDGEGYVIYYDHIDGLLGAHPDQFETLVEILRDAVESWKEDDEALVVLFSGAKAPKGVSKLKPASEE